MAHLSEEILSAIREYDNGELLEQLSEYIIDYKGDPSEIVVGEQEKASNNFLMGIIATAVVSAINKTGIQEIVQKKIEEKYNDFKKSVMEKVLRTHNPPEPAGQSLPVGGRNKKSKKRRNKISKKRKKGKSRTRRRSR